MTLVLTLPNGQPNEIVRLMTENLGSLLAMGLAFGTLPMTSPVYVEAYMAANGNDVRLATIAALQANTAPGITFVMPAGRFAFVGAAITLADGLRNGITISMYGCELFRDLGGIAGGSNIFFLRSDTGVGTHADRITIMGGKFSLLNALTSYFGYAVGFESASNCRIIDCEAFCTLAGGATTGRIRWGFALFGGDQVADPTAGTNNTFSRIKLTLSQIQACSAGRSVDGVVIDTVEVNQANDLAVSCVSTTGFNVRNVILNNLVCHDIAGSGGVLIGSDGNGTGIGAAIVENLTLTNLSLDGIRNPDLDFSFSSFIFVNGGILTQNINLAGVNTTFSSANVQAKSITIASQADEVSWFGLSVADSQLGIITTNDPLEALFIQGTNISQCEIVNVTVRGLRGVRIIDVDKLTISNLTTTDGQVLIRAETRNLSSVVIGDSSLRRTTGFAASVAFQSAAGKSMSNVAISNTVLDSTVAGLFTALNGGTMQMILANVYNTSGSNPTAETLTGIKRAVNTPGLIVLTTVSVIVPAVLAGQVGYVITSMAGTRLSDLAVGEGVLATPSAQLVAAGVGGAYANARVSSVGNVELAFLGPLAGGASNFNFARAAA